MKIILLRHGKPDITPCSKLKASELADWINAYNAAGIQQNKAPSLSAIERTQACNMIVCSDLKRSTESARALGVIHPSIASAVFREVGLAYTRWPPLRLPPMVWVTVFRLCQFFGFARNGESLLAARQRAREASRLLAAMAKQNESVLLVGHGYMNRLIAKQLLASGWQGPKSPGHRYWDFSIYHCNDITL